MKGFDFINTACIKSEQFNKTDDRVFKLLAVSMFLPFPITFAAVATVLGMILFNRRMRTATFSNNKATIALALFSVFGYTVAAVYRNWLGIIALVGVMAIVIIGQYMAAVSTERIFTGTVDTICSLAPIAALTTAAEFIIRHFWGSVPEQDIVFEFRCGGIFYLHPNYLGTFAAIIAVLCIYRFYTNPEHRTRYIISGICCIVCIILSGSMFACIELAVAALVMITYCRKWRSLAILSVSLIAAGIAVILVPELIPRLDQADGTFLNRVNVWQSSYEILKRTPIFGEGLMTYYHIYNTEGVISGIEMYRTQHAHNILLDSLVSFGIVGTAMIIAYIFLAWRKVASAIKSRSYPIEAALMVGVIVGALVHGMIDMTLMWVQPGLIFMMVISAGGFIIRNKN